MRFTAASALFALVSTVAAQIGTEPNANFNPIDVPAEGQEVSVGETFTIKWSLGSNKGSGKVKILLYGGKNFAGLLSKGVVAATVDNSELEYDWLVPASAAGDAAYGLQIVDLGDESLWQWSKSFKVVGDSSSGNDTSSSSTTSTTKATYTTSASSTATPTSAGNGTCTVGCGHHTSSTVSPPRPSGNGTSPTPPPQTTGVPAAGVAGAVVNGAAVLGGLAVAVLAL